MTPQRLAKIRALAADERGDPATRALAQKMLDAWEATYPAVKSIHPGMRTSPEYERWKRGLNIGKRRL